ncbi:alpha/beta hydrolase [Ruegeria arenilitoris]|uniref:alpha/beta hydrolase n=1 Tax=Ruegeria arenilitoris TaxID=1173585 RepID=UPI00147F54A8|nr:alpha/beta hydrolase [Ruegeria arenilitoris]
MSQAQSENKDVTLRTLRSIAEKQKGLLVLLALFVAAIYAAIVGYMYFNQRSLLFKPDGLLPEPRAVGLADVEVITLPMSDKTVLTAWAAPPAIEGAPTVLFFHGQTGNLGDRADRMREILNSGFGLLAPSYRGYPGSEGQPSELALISDGLQLFDGVASEGSAILLHGQSLGTAIAAAVAEQRPQAQLLVLEAPFTATVDVASERYPWIPVSALMKDQFATRDLIANITVPTLIFHGTHDETVPMHHSQTLADLAGENAQFHVITDGAHNDLWSHGLWNDVQNALQKN